MRPYKDDPGLLVFTLEYLAHFYGCPLPVSFPSGYFIPAAWKDYAPAGKPTKGTVSEGQMIKPTRDEIVRAVHSEEEYTQYGL